MGKWAMRAQLGFTLIELAIVLVILGVLAAIAAPKIGELLGNAEERALEVQAVKLRENNAINRTYCRSGSEDCTDIESSGSQACEEGLEHFLPGVDTDQFGVTSIHSDIPRDQWREAVEHFEAGDHNGGPSASDGWYQEDDAAGRSAALFWVDRFLGESEPPSESWLEDWDPRLPCILYRR